MGISKFLSSGTILLFKFYPLVYEGFVIYPLILCKILILQPKTSTTTKLEANVLIIPDLPCKIFNL